MQLHSKLLKSAEPLFQRQLLVYLFWPVGLNLVKTEHQWSKILNTLASDAVSSDFNRQAIFSRCCLRKEKTNEVKGYFVRFGSFYYNSFYTKIILTPMHFEVELV